MFTNTARMFKFDVLVAYAKQAFEEGKIDETKINAYAHDLYGYLLDNNIRADIDERAEKLGYRVREAQVKKIPYLIILGKQEAQDGTVSYRLHGQQNTTTVSKDEFLAMLKDEIATKKLSK